MAWRRSGDKPLSEPMMVSLLTHICVTRPQWVKEKESDTWSGKNTEVFQVNWVKTEHQCGGHGQRCLNYSKIQALYLLRDKTSCRKISWSLEAARFGFRLFQSLWNLTGTSKAALPRCLSNSITMQSLWHPISRLRDFTRFGGKTSYRLVNRGSDAGSFNMESNDFASDAWQSISAVLYLLFAPVPIKQPQGILLIEWRGCIKMVYNWNKKIKSKY